MPADLASAAVLKELPATRAGALAQGALCHEEQVSQGPGRRGSPSRQTFPLSPSKARRGLNNVLPRHNLLWSRPLVAADLG